MAVFFRICTTFSILTSPVLAEMLRSTRGEERGGRGRTRGAAARGARRDETRARGREQEARSAHARPVVDRGDAEEEEDVQARADRVEAEQEQNGRQARDGEHGVDGRRGHRRNGHARRLQQRRQPASVKALGRLRHRAGDVRQVRRQALQTRERAARGKRGAAVGGAR